MSRSLLRAWSRSPAAAYLLDAAGRLRAANPAWESLTGLPAEESRGLACGGRRAADPTPAQRVAYAMRPTPRSLAGRADVARRDDPAGRPGDFWEIDFFPLPADDGPPWLLGRVTPRRRPAESAARIDLAEHLIGLPARVASLYPFELLTGLDRVAARARLAASSEASLWVSGPAGSGRTTLARVVHHNGVTADRSFASVDAAALPGDVLRAVLFGRAGLAASPRVGTLVIAHPEAADADTLARLAGVAGRRLVVVSEHAVETSDLPGEFLAAAGVIEVRLPPLRDRPGDLPRLARTLLDRVAGRECHLTDSSVAVLRAYGWPGNLRELAGVLRQAAAGGGIDAERLPEWLRREASPAAAPAATPKPLPLDRILEDVERNVIALALRQAGGNKTEAADRLGVWRARLIRRVKALGLEE